MLFAIVECDRRFEVRTSQGQGTEVHERRAEHVMSLHHELWVCVDPSDAHQLVAELPAGLVLPARCGVQTKPPERSEALRRLPSSRGMIAGTLIRSLGVRRGPALDRLEHRTESSE